MAASASSFSYQLREAGTLLTYSQVRTEDDLSAAVTAMNEVLVDVLRDPVTGEEVDRAKTSLLNGVERTFNDPESIAFNSASGLLWAIGVSSSYTETGSKRSSLRMCTCCGGVPQI